MASPATSEDVPAGSLPALPFSEQEMDACLKVITCMQDNAELFAAPSARRLRKALTPLVDQMQKKKFSGVGHNKMLEDMAFKVIKNGIADKMRRLDDGAKARCRLRAERVAKMNVIMEAESQTANVHLIADGPALGGYHPMMITSATSDEQQQLSQQEKEPAGELFFPRECYVCKISFSKLHHFYHALCPDCAELNYTKRQQTADLHGKIALVTGARVKVGFFTTLKLLHAGATVIATTRFPWDAVMRFQQDPQYEHFKDRLHVFGIDLRDLVHLHCFLDFVASTFPRIDMVIHNACQTIRRPPQFYRHLMEKELKAGQETASPLLAHQTAFHAIKPDGQRVQQLAMASTEEKQSSSANGLIQPGQDRHDQHHHHGLPMSSALKSQIPLLHTDHDHEGAIEHFPEGAVDVHGRQVDLRTKNSWILRLGEVETPELAEVFTINAMAPFVINNRLLPMMSHPPTDPSSSAAGSPPDLAAFIINVSAMEGKFYRTKKPTHPHTNMAKAALNMMTRTCAGDLKLQHNIYMNSVDTGWINDENPVHVAVHAAATYGFQTPLDEIDAAARVLDPIFTTDEPKLFGCFFKDYKPTDW